MSNICSSLNSSKDPTNTQRMQKLCQLLWVCNLPEIAHVSPKLPELPSSTASDKDSFNLFSFFLNLCQASLDK